LTKVTSVNGPASGPTVTFIVELPCVNVRSGSALAAAPRTRRSSRRPVLASPDALPTTTDETMVRGFGYDSAEPAAALASPSSPQEPGTGAARRIAGDGHRLA
jgi:hypothetical protein